jgi:hypothetical protein
MFKEMQQERMLLRKYISMIVWPLHSLKLDVGMVSGHAAGPRFDWKEKQIGVLKH